MSETTEAGAAGASEAATPAETPTETPTETPNEAAATPDDQPAAKPAGDEHDPAVKRINRLTGRLSMTMRENAELAARIAELERGQQSPDAANRQAEIEAAAERIVAERRSRERVEAFHEAGRDAFGAADWRARCEALMAMGADAGLSNLLVEMKDGPKVAAALHDDPDELERIARLSTPTARAIALGLYAGRLEATAPATSPAAAPAARTVSRTPPPIRPVQGRAQPAFDEYRAGNASDGNAALVEYYAKQERIRRGLSG